MSKKSFREEVFDLAGSFHSKNGLSIWFFIHELHSPLSCQTPKGIKKKKAQTFSCFVRAVIKSILPPWQYFKLIHQQNINKKCKKI